MTKLSFNAIIIPDWCIGIVACGTRGPVQPPVEVEK